MIMWKHFCVRSHSMAIAIFENGNKECNYKVRDVLKPRKTGRRTVKNVRNVRSVGVMPISVGYFTLT